MSCSVTCTGQTGPDAGIAREVFAAALADLGVPNPGAHNLNNLMTWYPYEGVGGYNPLGIEGGDTGCGFWNYACVSCFCSVAQGGSEYASRWGPNGLYPAIHTCLANDLPLDQWACVPGLLDNLQGWATGDFGPPYTYAWALHVQAAAACSASSPPPSSPPPSSPPSSTPAPSSAPTSVAPPPPQGEVVAGGSSVASGLFLLAGGAGLGYLALRSHRRTPPPPGLSFRAVRPSRRSG